MVPTPTALIEFDHPMYFCSSPYLDNIYPNDITIEFETPILVEAMAATLRDFIQQCPQLFKVILERDGKWFLAPMPQHLRDKSVIISERPWQDHFHQTLDQAEDSIHAFILAADGRYLMHRISHSITDGYSSKMILTVILDAYRARLAGESFSFPPFEIGRLTEHYRAAKEVKGKRVNRTWLMVRGLWTYLTMPKLSATPFSDHSSQDYFRREFILPDLVYDLLAYSREHEPGITLNDWMLTFLVDAYSELTGDTWIRLSQQHNLRPATRRYEMGMLLASMNMTIPRFPNISLANAQRLHQARCKIQHSP